MRLFRSLQIDYFSHYRANKKTVVSWTRISVPFQQSILLPSHFWNWKKPRIFWLKNKTMPAATTITSIPFISLHRHHEIRLKSPNTRLCNSHFDYNSGNKITSAMTTISSIMFFPQLLRNERKLQKSKDSWLTWVCTSLRTEWKHVQINSYDDLIINRKTGAMAMTYHFQVNCNGAMQFKDQPSQTANEKHSGNRTANQFITESFAIDIPPVMINQSE